MKNGILTMIGGAIALGGMVAFSKSKNTTNVAAQDTVSDKFLSGAVIAVGLLIIYKSIK
jgi:hypothetical protein